MTVELEEKTKDLLMKRFLVLQGRVKAGMKDLPTVDQVLSGMGLRPDREMTVDEQMLLNVEFIYQLKDNHRDMHLILYEARLIRWIEYITEYYAPEMAIIAYSAAKNMNLEMTEGFKKSESFINYMNKYKAVLVV